jgi:adenine-specific DNA-methyltransferase
MLKKENLEADTTALEREIDEMVYALYELSAEEIAIVEGS